MLLREVVVCPSYLESGPGGKLEQKVYALARKASILKTMDMISYSYSHSNQTKDHLEVT